MEHKYIIQITSDDFEGIKYLMSIGKLLWTAKFSYNIYDSKFYETYEAAVKAADKAKKFVETCYKKGYTSYGWWVDENGDCFPSLKSIETEVIKVKLELIG